MQQRKEEHVLRLSMSPKLAKKSVPGERKRKRPAGGAPQPTVRPRVMDPYALQQQEMGLVPMCAEWDDGEDVDMMDVGYAGETRKGLDGFQGLSFQYEVKSPSASVGSHGYHPSLYPPHSSSGTNIAYLSSPHHLPTATHRTTTYHPSPSSSNPSLTHYPHSNSASTSTSSLGIPLPLLQLAPPACSDADLEAFWSIVSTDPPSSYAGFASAPVVESNLHFIPPNPCDFTDPTSGLEDPFVAQAEEPEFYAPLLPAMSGGPASSPIGMAGGVVDQWTTLGSSTSDGSSTSLGGAEGEDWTQLLLHDSSPIAGDAGLSVPGAVDNSYLPLDLGGLGMGGFSDGAFNEV